MDTSNSQQKRPVDHLLGSKFSQGQFTQKDWVRILSTVLEEAGPQLKYLSAMCDPKAIFNRTSERFTFFLTNDQFKQLHPDLITGVKGMILCSFNFDPLILEPIKVPLEEDLLYDSFLVLTTKKKLFRVFANYKRINEKGGRWAIKCLTSSIVASPVELQELDMTKKVGTKVEFCDLCVATEILNGFNTAFEQTIDIKQGHLDSMLETQREIRNKMEPLDIFNDRFVL